MFNGNMMSLKLTILDHRRHLENLSKAKSVVNTSQPSKSVKYMSRLTNKYSNTQKQQLFQENQILLKKMMKIEQRSQSINPLTRPNIDLRYLHTYQRIKDQEKINFENQQFVKRLQEQAPTYKKKQWIQEIRQEQDLLKLIQKKRKPCDFNTLVKQENWSRTQSQILPSLKPQLQSSQQIKRSVQENRPKDEKEKNYLKLQIEKNQQLIKKEQQQQQTQQQSQQPPKQEKKVEQSEQNQKNDSTLKNQEQQNIREIQQNKEKKETIKNQTKMEEIKESQEHIEEQEESIKDKNSIVLEQQKQSQYEEPNEEIKEQQQQKQNEEINAQTKNQEDPNKQQDQITQNKEKENQISQIQTEQKYICNNCKLEFNSDSVIARIVPCEKRHIFCEQCLRENKKCFNDDYNFEEDPSTFEKPTSNQIEEQQKN